MKKDKTKAVYVRSNSVGFSGADSVFMKITMPRPPWDQDEDDGAPGGAFREVKSAKERLGKQERRA